MQHDEPFSPQWGKVRSASELGHRISDGRRHQNLTQGDLANWLGVDRTTVLRLEAGKVGQINRLFDILGVLGLDLVVVPRTARVVVEPVTDQPPA
jgi:transcriptional regulator with XRE-family HTH domain